MMKVIATAAFAVTSLLGFTSRSDVSPRWRATLQPVGTTSKVSGSAMLDEVGTDSTRFNVSVRNAPASASLPWHLHSGGCSTDGPVIGNASGYPDLRTSASGTGETTVVLAVVPPKSGAYSIHVHAPANAPSPMKQDSANPAMAPAAGPPPAVACGELKSSTE